MRDSLPVIFFAIFGIVFVTLLVLGQQRQQRQLLERLASRFRGRLEGSDIWSEPQVRLKFQGYPALLKYVHVSKQTHTVFTITWPDDRLRCEVYPQDIFSGFRKLLGAHDIEIGSAQFDAEYFITGNNPAAVRELLTSEVQGYVFRLASLTATNFFATREIQVKWAGGVLTVTKPIRLSTFESLEQFLSLCGLLFTAAMRTRATGIEFLSDVKEPDTAEAQCQVCGESLTGELVYCASCETPHHRDCWQYFGGCSTYACGGKNCLEQPKPQRRRKAS